jgi:hypothetical protein
MIRVLLFNQNKIFKALVCSSLQKNKRLILGASVVLGNFLFPT